MAILQSCCCWRTVRQGSFASAIYTMIYFTISALFNAILVYEEKLYLTSNAEKPHVPSILEPNTISPTSVIFGAICLCCSSLGIISTFLLLYGLWKDIRLLLLPWIFNLLSLTALDLAHAAYIFISDSLTFNPISAILITMDVFIISINIYSMLCVVSQYQEYLAGRGTAEYDRELAIPCVRYSTQPTATSCLSTRRAVTYHETRPTPTQSPTVAHTSLGIGPPDDPTGLLSQRSGSLSSTRQPSRKHVQFPDQNNSTTTTTPDRRGSTNTENEEPWTTDIKTPMLYVPD